MARNCSDSLHSSLLVQTFKNSSNISSGLIELCAISGLPVSGNSPHPPPPAPPYLCVNVFCSPFFTSLPWKSVCMFPLLVFLYNNQLSVMKHYNSPVLQQLKAWLTYNNTYTVYIIHSLPTHMHPGVWFQKLHLGHRIISAQHIHDIQMYKMYQIQNLQRQGTL